MPTHLFLQAGVGSFAGSIMGYFIEKMQQQAPTIIIVEPHKANCLRFARQPLMMDCRTASAGICQP